MSRKNRDVLVSFAFLILLASSILFYLYIRGFAFNTITAYHNIDNPASGKVLTKSGMSQTEIISKGARKNTGELVDKVIYKISKLK